ncbi:MAG TPA: J domain-containing protein [Candidatus Limnocylindrales bacterium]|nr:J domain-containing protein [Candidatus Limnocylindrales bacterium]
MAQPLDPYRTLGLSPGASADEIRRAYRKLAKANHPDSAGEAALPRFLAIQAAYEMLIEGGTRPAPRRAAARPPQRQQPAGEPWQADPTRARATRDSYARSRRGGSGGATANGNRAETGRTGTSASAGGGSQTNGTSDRSRRGRSRPPNKATLGSTSYDAAEDEPFEPDWSGGTWYGASSGTYWTINPKEYADPRKHGPEYQRRARRRLDGVEYDPADDDPELSGDDFEGQESETTTGSERRGFDGRWAYPDDDGYAPGEDAATSGPDARWNDDVLTPDPRPTAAETADRLLAGNVGLIGRLLLAFVGWAPIAAMVGWVTGEVSGCSRFTATCGDPGGIWVIAPNLVVAVLLFALPRVAAISAAGAIGALVVSAPTAVVLSAAGGAHEPVAASAIISIAAVVGYVAGAAFATGRRLGWRRVP